jgi:ribosomal protein S18 acetylase RimI-like enzyme
VVVGGAARAGHGHGTELVADLLAEARKRNVESVIVGTANCSLDNIAFYQRCGFRMDSVRRDYFDYIDPPIIENGIRMRDMLVFRVPLR